MAGKPNRQGKVEKGPGVGRGLAPALAVVLVVAAGVVTARTQGNAAARSSAAELLDAGHSAHLAFRQQRHRELELIAKVVATDPLLVTYLTTAAAARDRTALLDVVDEYLNQLHFDVAVVLDSNGVVLARTDAPGAQGEALGDSPLLAQTAKEGRAFGAWRLAAPNARSGYRLHHAFAASLVKDFERVGYLVVGFALDDTVAVQMKRVTGADMVYLVSTPTGPAVAAATLEPVLADELVDALRRQGDAVARTLTRGETVSGEELPLGGGAWRILMTPLVDAAGQPLGAAMALSSLERTEAPWAQVSRALLVAGAIGLGLVLVIAWIGRTTAAAPAERLASYGEALRQGRLDLEPPPPGPGAFGRLAAALAGLRTELAQREAVRSWVARARRAVPEGSAKPTAVAATQKAALLAVEMRRFADPKTGYDAEASLQRFARDLRRIDAAVTTHGGRLEAVSGHRALALFAGDGAAPRALAAATEVLLALSLKETAFEEVEPPVLALTSGNAVTGPVVVQGRPAPAVAGLPVQQLESLMREATPGELFLSRTMQAELAAHLQAAGVTVRSQRPILGTQPLYVLDAATAQRATGVTEPTLAVVAEGARELADLAPGVLVGDRFELRAEDGRDWAGAVFEAFDRHRGDVVRLRLIAPELVADRSAAAAVRQRLQRACSVAHPGILTSWDEGEADGFVYVVAELVRATRLRRLIEAAGPASAAAARPLLHQVATGLWGAHRSEVLHGALDTDAVLVTGAGDVRIADLGVAPRRLAGAALASPFRASEQLAGGEIDRRADVFAFGVLAFVVLTGRAPWSADPSAPRREPPPLGSARPEAAPFDALVRRCLAVSPADRPASFEDVLRDLAALG